MQKSDFVVTPELTILINGNFSEIYKCILPPELQTHQFPQRQKLLYGGIFLFWEPNQ